MNINVCARRLSGTMPVVRRPRPSAPMAGERLLHVGFGKSTFYYQTRGPKKYASRRIRLGGFEDETFGCKRQRPLKESPAQTDHQVIVRPRQRSPDYNRSWVEKASDIGDHLAQYASRLPHPLNSLGAIRFDERHDVSRTICGDAQGAKIPGKRPSGGVGLKATQHPAAT